MELELNEKQSEKLADLCFDVTKGLLLGGLGLIFIRQVDFAILTISFLAFFSFTLVKFGLYLLR